MGTISTWTHHKTKDQEENPTHMPKEVGFRKMIFLDARREVYVYKTRTMCPTFQTLLWQLSQLHFTITGTYISQTATLKKLLLLVVPLYQLYLFPINKQTIVVELAIPSIKRII